MEGKDFGQKRCVFFKHSHQTMLDTAESDAKASSNYLSGDIPIMKHPPQKKTKYSITDCDHGSLSLSFGSQTSSFNIDLDNVDSGNLAHNAVALGTNPGRDEAFQLSRTVDPAGCGSTFTWTAKTPMRPNERLILTGTESPRW